MPHFNDNIANQQLPDGGPLYTETNLSNLICEPYNMVTAAFFLFIGLYFAWQIRGNFRHLPMFAGGVALLILGGVGGTLFHGFRAYAVFLYLDVVPIIFITLLFCLYAWRTVLKNWRTVFFIVGGGYTIPTLLLRLLVLPKNVAISLNYAILGILVIVPLILLVRHNQYRKWGYVACSISAFGIAVVFRLADAIKPPILPMGTHWLWHSFGAITTGCAMYFWLSFATQKQIEDGQ